MARRMLRFVGLALFCAARLPCFADPTGIIGLHGDYLSPQDDFKDNLDTRAWGGDATVVWNIEETPFALGVLFEAYSYGHTTFEESVHPLTPNVTVEIDRRNWIYNLSAVARFTPFGDSALCPYAEVGVGAMWLRTATSVELDGEDIAHHEDQGDVVASYGFSVGLLLEVAHWEPEPGHECHIFLDVRYRRVYASDAEYLGNVGGRGDTYEVIESDVTYDAVQVGVAFGF